MQDDSGEFVIIYNGEIYNFPEIKKDLKKKGYRFKSRTDTEVILYAYKEWGLECVQRFNGMFSFGIYDSNNKKIFIARDRAGKKPLYYARYRGKFVFASELKSLFCDPEFPEDIDLQALNFFLTFGYIPFDLSIYKYARKLPPAHMMVYDLEKNKFQISRYWSVPEQDNKKHREADLLEELEFLLEDAVRLRLISDVPIGAFLSGGLDSSLVVAMMCRVSTGNVKTFSIGFTEKSHNELPYAKIVADYFGTEHKEFIVNPAEKNIINELAIQFDEPFADSSLIPTYYVSKMTRDHVTVALSGDGGDELFGGYSTYLATLGNLYANRVLPSILRRSISKLSEKVSDKNKIKKQLVRLKYSADEAFIDRITQAGFKLECRKRLFNSSATNMLSDDFKMPEEGIMKILSSSKRDFLNTMGYAHFISFLPDDILTKVDRMSMKVSLEVRCPFLDHRIIEFAFKKLRGDFKIKGGRRKYILKKLASKILPGELDINRKWGFNVPVSKWFRTDYNSYIKEVFLSGNNTFFDLSYVEQLLAEHSKGIDHGSRIFVLLSFYLWYKRINQLQVS
jgi:asparagine synthase (glutamine-hydrolysing)